MFFSDESARSRNSCMRRPRASNQISGVPIRSIPESVRFFWNFDMLQKRKCRESVSFSVRIGFFWVRFQGNSIDRTAASGLENEIMYALGWRQQRIPFLSQRHIEGILLDEQKLCTQCHSSARWYQNSVPFWATRRGYIAWEISIMCVMGWLRAPALQMWCYRLVDDGRWILICRK